MGWLQHAYGGGAVLALLLAALVRFFPRHGVRKDIEISPTILGYLIGGRRRAVVTALAMLYTHGAVRVAGQGMVRPTSGKFASRDRLLSATYSAMYQATGPRGITPRPQVDRAVADVRKDLVAAWLWLPTDRWVAVRVLVTLCPLLLSIQLETVHDAASITLAATVFVLVGALNLLDRRTRSGRARTARLRRAHPVSNAGPDADSVGYTVAAHGKRALLAIMPRFAKDGGLLDGGTIATYLGDGTAAPNSNAMNGG